jgi:hypothetical protein
MPSNYSRIERLLDLFEAQQGAFEDIDRLLVEGGRCAPRLLSRLPPRRSAITGLPAAIARLARSKSFARKNKRPASKAREDR